MSFEGKIVFLVPGFPEDEEDQNCLPYLQDLMLLLNDRLSPDQIEIISFQYPFKRSSYIWNGIQVHTIGGKNRKGVFKIITWIRVLSLLKSIHNNRNISVLHAVWLNETALLAQIFGYFFKIKTLATIIGQDPLKSNKYLKLLNLKNFRLIGISSFVSVQLLANTGHAPEDIIPLVWREEVFNDLPISTINVDVLGVGNLSPLKNYKLFIEVIALLVPELPNIKSVIVGSGKQHDELQRLITEKQLHNNIQLLGETDRNLVLSIMQHGKVLLHTSNYESQGFAMSEALYLGMKVVSTPVSDTESNHYIQVGKTAEDLANCVHKALSNETRESIVYYSPEKAVDQYISHYLTLTK